MKWNDGIGKERASENDDRTKKMLTVMVRRHLKRSERGPHTELASSARSSPQMLTRSFQNSRETLSALSLNGERWRLYTSNNSSTVVNGNGQEEPCRLGRPLCYTVKLRARCEWPEDFELVRKTFSLGPFFFFFFSFQLLVMFWRPWLSYSRRRREKKYDPLSCSYTNALARHLSVPSLIERNGPPFLRS